jgi:hypothetical protein
MVFDAISYNKAKKAYDLASKHAARHEYGGEDLVRNLDYLAIRGTTILEPAVYGANLKNIQRVGTDLIPDTDGAYTLGLSGNAWDKLNLYNAYIYYLYPKAGNDTGSIGTSTVRWGYAYIGRILNLDYANFAATTTDPDRKGELKFVDPRLKFYDGSAVRTVAWLDPDVLGGLDPNSLAAYFVTGKGVALYGEGEYWAALCYPDLYADLAISCVNSNTRGVSPAVAGRVQSNAAGAYYNDVNTGATTADHELVRVNTDKTMTLLGSEAVDLNASRPYTMKLRCSGSTIESYRSGAATPQISATDTTFTSGSWGVLYYYTGYEIYVGGKEINILTAKKTSASLPPPKPVAYFEVPIIGSGTPDDPFRAAMPVETFEFETPNKKLCNGLKAKGFTDEEIFKFFGLTPDFVGNRLAVSYSALIPGDKSGKPIHGTALVRVFPQPDRDPNLYPISKCLDALRAVKGVSELKPEDAKSFAKSLDDRLREGELEFMVNPTEENELHSLADFYEREVVDEKRIKPEQLTDFNSTLEGYAKRSEKIGRNDLAQRFRAIMKKS